MGKFKQAEPKDIFEGNTVHIEDDSGALIEMRIYEVLKPSDQWKAFCGDDGCRYGLDGCFIKTPEPMEEYTGPRRCDLCKFEKELPCTEKGCNSVNNLDSFEPKGSGPEKQEGIKVLLDMELNGELEFAHGRYIRAPGGWVFESNQEVAICFIPEPK